MECGIPERKQLMVVLVINSIKRKIEKYVVITEYLTTH